MKTYLFLILVLSQFCFSQSFETYRFGVRAGSNLSIIVRDEISRTQFNDPHYIMGYYFGFIFDKVINERTVLQGEILYNQVGSKWGGPFFGAWDGDYAQYNLKYITIPIYFKLDSRIGNQFKDFDVIVGASYSYNIYARQKVVIESYTELNYGPDNLRGEINPHEIGILAGLKIPFVEGKIDVSIHYYWAITKLYGRKSKTYPDGLEDKSGFKNRNLSLGFDFFIF